MLLFARLHLAVGLLVATCAPLATATEGLVMPPVPLGTITNASLRVAVKSIMVSEVPPLPMHHALLDAAFKEPATHRVALLDYLFQGGIEIQDHNQCIDLLIRATFLGDPKALKLLYKAGRHYLTPRLKKIVGRALVDSLFNYPKSFPKHSHPHMMAALLQEGLYDPARLPKVTMPWQGWSFDLLLVGGYLLSPLGIKAFTYFKLDKEHDTFVLYLPSFIYEFLVVPLIGLFVLSIVFSLWSLLSYFGIQLPLYQHALLLKNTPPLSYLHLAVQQGDIAMVRVFLAYGADPNVTTCVQHRWGSFVAGITPLHLALIARNEALVKVLVRAGADVHQAMVTYFFDPALGKEVDKDMGIALGSRYTSKVKQCPLQLVPRTLPLYDYLLQQGAR